MFNGPEICAGDEKTNRNTERENRHEQKHLLQAVLATATVYLLFFKKKRPAKGSNSLIRCSITWKEAERQQQQRDE